MSPLAASKGLEKNGRFNCDLLSDLQGFWLKLCVRLAPTATLADRKSWPAKDWLRISLACAHFDRSLCRTSHVAPSPKKRLNMIGGAAGLLSNIGIWVAWLGFVAA